MYGINNYARTANIAYNNWTTHNKAVNKALQRLSSGLRINSAADDPAGLCIVEKLRMQVRGINQAIRNAMDTQSYLTIAEGQASSVNDMLQRGRELALRAANGTLSDDDRKAANLEWTELKKDLGSMTGKNIAGGVEIGKEDQYGNIVIQPKLGAGAGDDAEDSVVLFSLTGQSLGLTGVTLATQKDAQDALGKFDAAIAMTSQIRSYYGSRSNGLDSAIDQMTTYATNLQEAQSRIEDADMAKEIMEYTKHNILSQVSQSVMAQANQGAQEVLHLIKKSLNQE